MKQYFTKLLHVRTALALLLTVVLTMTAQTAWAGIYLYLVEDNSTTATIKCSETIPSGYSQYGYGSLLYCGKDFNNYPYWTNCKDAYKTVNIDNSCLNYTGNRLDCFFCGFNNLEVINGLENLRTDDVKDISLMFSGCSKLKSVNVSSFNMEKVEFMEVMFHSCSSLTEIDLSAWNTPELVRMENMFTNCTNLKTIIVGVGWNTSKVRFDWGSEVFNGCTSLVGGKGTQCQGTDEQHQENDHNYINADGLNNQPGYMTGDWTVFHTGNDADNAYIIDNKLLLDHLSRRVNAGETYQGKFFKLGDDIEYDKTVENNFTPIGTGNHRFAGTFAGNEKTISGINISTSSFVGLFGGADGATIKNLKLDNSTFNGSYDYTGAILGSDINTTVENCLVTSNVTVSGSSYVGGLVGNSATITGCACAAKVSGKQYVGGIIGHSYLSTVTNCLYTGNSVSGSNDYVGAIVGEKRNCTLNYNYYTANVSCGGGFGQSGTNVG